MGYSSRYWMTYRQAEALGGQVRKGETSSLSVYYSQISKTEPDRVTGEDHTRAIRFLKAYNVFNADQIDGLGNTDERYAMRIELFDDTGKVHQASGETVHLIDHHYINTPF